MPMLCMNESFMKVKRFNTVSQYLKYIAIFNVPYTIAKRESHNSRTTGLKSDFKC